LVLQCLLANGQLQQLFSSNRKAGIGTGGISDANAHPDDDHVSGSCGQGFSGIGFLQYFNFHWFHLDPDPDPADQVNADSDSQHCFLWVFAGPDCVDHSFAMLPTEDLF
jgi:hypothetical protein